MQDNHIRARFRAIVRKHRESLAGPRVRASSRDTKRPAAWSIKCNWRAWLVTANGLASDHLIATVTDGRLFAALHLILPDFPIIAVLAHLSGWEGL